jgi:hypothetical protein
MPTVHTIAGALQLISASLTVQTISVLLIRTALMELAILHTLVGARVGMEMISGLRTEATVTIGTSPTSIMIGTEVFGCLAEWL